MILLKKYILLLISVMSLATSFTAICATRKLVFTCDKDRKIMKYGKFDGMQFAVEPEDFVGQDIAKFVTEEYHKEVIDAFAAAASSKTEAYVVYMLKGEKFKSEITPLNSQDGDTVFVVTVFEQTEI